MIRIGMCVYGADPETLQRVVNNALFVSDQLVVVYGRFKDFNLPWEPPSRFLIENKKIKFHVQDQINTQDMQRDIYLDGLTEGDIIFIQDPDESYSFFLSEFRQILNSFEHSSYDSASIVFHKENNQYEQTPIRIFKYSKGDHHKGGILYDKHGNPKTEPYYRVLKIPDDIFYVTHHRDQSPEYRSAQKVYWSNK